MALILLIMWSMEEKTPKRIWLSIPPWFLVGTVGVLLPIFIFMTWKYIHRQKQSATELLVEKGAALIRSFEAGARTGMMGMNWGGVQVQQLLSETAKQPDIIYIMVTDTKGRILAHSNPTLIGRTYRTGLDLFQVWQSAQTQWHHVRGEEGKEVFEVYSRFMPIRGRAFHPRMPMMGMRGQMDWCRAMIFPEASGPEQGRIIFVGLDMAPVEAARKQDERHMVLMALTLLLVGFAGFVTLFLAQAYRSTRTSLSRIKAFSDQLVETMPIGMVALDEGGSVRAMNKAAEQILKISEYGTKKKKAEELLCPEMMAMVEKALHEMVTVEDEITCPVDDSGPLSLEVIVTPLSIGEQESFSGLVLLFRDLTEIRRLKEEVARSQRLASIGRLAAGVAHEIRNPLSSIKGFATYFKERYKDVPQDQRTANIMVQEVDRLNRVVSQLLEFARPATIQKEATEILGLIKDSLRMVEDDAIKKSIRIEASSSNDEIVALVDPDRIKQVLLNLYLNAIEAMEEGGVLRVNAQKDSGDSIVSIVVEDTGHGIAHRDLPHVFDPYFTTKPSGTGLGLAIAHKIVESHGGELMIQSEEDKGTKVIIRLPIIDV